MKEKDYSYPNYDDNDIQEKIYKKREFYFNRIPQRDILQEYKDIEEYREENCADNEDFELKEHQKIISNLMNPNTPYNGILLMYGTGTGKTASAISIAEQFKPQVKKYNTKVYVLVPGSNTRENFKSELVFTTGDTYIKNKLLLKQMTKDEQERERKMAIFGALQYYKILSYKTFHRKILGEKVIEKKLVDDKLVSSYKKNEDGEIEREIVIDRIDNMDNSVIIVDEAHNLTGNEWGDSLKLIAKKSKNLKIILLTATPMKNLPDDIIDLINFIRPPNNQIRRDQIFTSDKNYNMTFKPDGEKILAEMSRGYVSYFRGNIPYTFAKRIDKGEIPNGLLFTPVIKSKMLPFQLETYKKANENFDDTLDRASSAAANFVFPGLSDDKKNLTGYYSNDGVNKLITLLKNNKTKLFKLINKNIYRNKLNKSTLDKFISVSDSKKISGFILHLDYLKDFSIKFYNCINNINKLYKYNKGTAFIYSNLVKAGGIELFASALEENGYLEYQENFSDYIFKDNTIDSITGKTYSQFKKEKLNLNNFFPSTYITVTGASEDATDDQSEYKQRIIRQVFNQPENKYGKFLKLVLGSKVMNEGVTLENVKEIHILDVHYNLGKVEQVIGRGIRMCKHKAVINDNNKFPKVNVYRYVVSLDKQLSTDEILYQKAELKYLLVKKVERILKTNAIDCPLLLHGNKFPEEIKEYQNCSYPTLENIKKGKKICPSLCDFTDCNLKCSSQNLNKKYYDEKNKTYKLLDKNDIDFNTFDNNMAKYEINSIKNKIKDLFRFKHILTYQEIKDKIINSFNKFQKELFQDIFLDEALQALSPKTENDFNNFNDYVYDKYNREGYIIQKDINFIFQPFDENEDVSLHYRKNITIPNNNLVSVNNFSNSKFGEIKKSKETTKIKKIKNYDFDSTLSYYNDRDEFFIVGIIDKNLNKNVSDNDDIFKIRDPRPKKADKKRGTGIPTLKGAVCSTSKDKDYLINKLKNIKQYNFDIKKLSKMTRSKICNEIKNILLDLEKYSTTKDKNKMTYIMIPKDHPIYPFPYNLEDRVKYTISKIKKIVDREFKFITKKEKNKYTIEITIDKYINKNIDKIKEFNPKIYDKYIQIILE